MSVLIVGTLDTKGIEIAFVRDRLLAAGVPVLIADAGVLGDPLFAPDISREQLFQTAGVKSDDLKRDADRGKAIERAAVGAAKIAEQLHRDGKLTGVLGLGGSAGTTIATAAMRAVPVGVVQGRAGMGPKH